MNGSAVYGWCNEGTDRPDRPYTVSSGPGRNLQAVPGPHPNPTGAADEVTTEMPTSNHQIKIDLATDDRGRKVLVASGDIDLQTAPTFRRQIERAVEPGELLVIDLRQVTFMDSPGLGTLVYCDRLQRERGGQLVLKDPSGPVRELLDMVGLAEIIDIE